MNVFSCPDCRCEPCTCGKCDGDAPCCLVFTFAGFYVGDACDCQMCEELNNSFPARSHGNCSWRGTTCLGVGAPTICGTTHNSGVAAVLATLSLEGSNYWLTVELTNHIGNVVYFRFRKDLGTSAPDCSAWEDLDIPFDSVVTEFPSYRGPCPTDLVTCSVTATTETCDPPPAACVPPVVLNTCCNPNASLEECVSGTFHCQTPCALTFIRQDWDGEYPCCTWTNRTYNLEPRGGEFPTPGVCIWDWQDGTATCGFIPIGGGFGSGQEVSAWLEQSGSDVYWHAIYNWQFQLGAQGATNDYVMLLFHYRAVDPCPLVGSTFATVGDWVMERISPVALPVDFPCDDTTPDAPILVARDQTCGDPLVVCEVHDPCVVKDPCTITSVAGTLEDDPLCSENDPPCTCINELSGEQVGDASGGTFEGRCNGPAFDRCAEQSACILYCVDGFLENDPDCDADGGDCINELGPQQIGESCLGDFDGVCCGEPFDDTCYDDDGEPLQWFAFCSNETSLWTAAAVDEPERDGQPDTCAGDCIYKAGLCMDCTGSEGTFAWLPCSTDPESEGDCEECPEPCDPDFNFLTCPEEGGLWFVDTFDDDSDCCGGNCVASDGGSAVEGEPCDAFDLAGPIVECLPCPNGREEYAVNPPNGYWRCIPD